MDITAYQEAIRKGQTIDFAISKKKIAALILLCVGLAIASSGMIFFSKRDVGGMLIGIVSFFVFAGTAWILGRSLSNHRVPKVLSISKDVLTVYDLSLSALAGKNSPCVLIPWHEIIDLSIETFKTRNAQNTYLVLECTAPTIQNIQQHQKQVSGNLLRAYEINDNFVLLNLHSWLDISLQELLELLRELHQESMRSQGS